ncbi:MAG: TolC family protein [Bacteroidota bacterium]|nr:TolC family protein [Bacteroidota bacterium]
MKKKNLKNKLLTIVFMLLSIASKADTTYIFTLNEFLASVVKFHPIAKQAGLLNLKADANLMMARGNFDPNLSGTYDAKTFDNKNYWQQLLTEISIPTWYGLQPKIGYELNEGIRESDNSFRYLGNENVNLPNGLLYAGVKASLGSGLVLDERRSILKQAKLLLAQNEFDRQNALNDLLFEAFDAYNAWYLSHNKINVLSNALATGSLRLNAIKRLAELGDLAGIDTVETLTQIQMFELMLNDAKIELTHQQFWLNTFLWDENQSPIYLEPNIKPESLKNNSLNVQDTILKSTNFNAIIQQHPKIKSIVSKTEQLDIEALLKTNKLLPKLDLNYNILLNDATNNPPLQYGNYTQNYKWGAELKIPIFLRTERANLNLTKLKIQETDLYLAQTENELNNKAISYQQQFAILQQQLVLSQKMVNNYRLLLNSEQQKFDLGESSIFLLNSREQKLFESELKLMELEYKYFKTLSALKWSLSLWVNG